MVVWKDFRPPYIPENILKKSIQHMMFEHFTRRSQFSVGNRSIHFTCEANGKINFNHIYLLTKLLLFINIFD
jgi:hypothetical protein